MVAVLLSTDEAEGIPASVSIPHESNMNKKCLDEEHAQCPAYLRIASASDAIC